ncbi:hypothetical protein CTAYLR_007356 [Chrysophaeum taylorii]|uniref:SPX domain-containing protein n=1 Tax=Chrysophaeum taylorii TaxID=2483200 RepID=A0AAD7U4G6_9STRA|nr:hypothetical protein CTAYLR_007356 [Chrysophaeum taylorii]
MVAFGDTIEDAKAQSSYPSWAYLDYSKLKRMLYDLALLNLREPVDENAMSLSVTPATNAAAMPTLVVDADDSEDEMSLAAADEGRPVATHEGFLSLLESELRKMDKFTHEEVVKVRRSLEGLEGASKHEIAADVEGFSDRCSAAGSAFLEIEKYVNLNVTAVRKLLKKHDKVLPTLPPIKAFYIARMHDMRWVRNDYSDVVVRLSRLYAKAEVSSGGDDVERGPKTYDDQSFVRTTSKFWVKPDDLSAVKLAISKHLPVLLQKEMLAGQQKEQKDSQLVNSVYLDSSTLELYHSRLAKLPGSSCVRLRWYGTGEPTLVFVERKTHRDAWTGDESVKERFAIPPEQVPKLLRGDFDADAFEASARAAGKKSDAVIRKERQLVDEITQLISTKRLVPTVRSQCMRCAFQQEHTNAVRASVDTNLCLISEVQHATPPQPETLSSSSSKKKSLAERSFLPPEDETKEYELRGSPDAASTTTKEKEQRDRWYRDPKTSIPRNEITRFPFAVLEIKLALGQTDELPDWVRSLADSRALVPVHKFSKFIHGTAVLLPDEVQTLPYWIDDPALAASIKSVGPAAASVLRDRTNDAKSPLDNVLGSRAPTSEHYERIAAKKKARLAWNDDDDYELPRYIGDSPSCFAACPNQGDLCPAALDDRCCPVDADVRREMQTLLPSQKIEPKLFLAAERTFIHWLHAAVVLTSIGAVGLAAAHANELRNQRNRRTEAYSALLSITACVLTAYALRTLSWRLDHIASHAPTEWSDPLGPLVLGGLAVLVLSTIWVVELANFLTPPSLP